MIIKKSMCRFAGSVTFGILLCMQLSVRPSSTDEKKASLRTMAWLYPKYERLVLNSLPGFGVYTTSIDTSLITCYAQLVSEVLAQKHLSAEDKQFVKKIATHMTRGSVYRNASADSRWRNYAKQSIIQALQTSSTGRAILKSLVTDNPQLEAEIEAYTMSEIKPLLIT